jgi:hypothetical protein
VLTTHTQVPVVAETCSCDEEGWREGGDASASSPRWLRIFFRRSRSSRILESRTVEVACGRVQRQDSVGDTGFNELKVTGG